MMREPSASADLDILAVPSVRLITRAPAGGAPTGHPGGGREHHHRSFDSAPILKSPSVSPPPLFCPPHPSMGQVMGDPGYLDDLLASGAERASEVADATLESVRDAMGFLHAGKARAPVGFKL